MKIIIQNIEFDYNIGCGLLKLKYNECPFPELSDSWDDIKPLSFKEIAEFNNLEQRRVGILCLGLERLVKEVNPILINEKTITKTTNWVGDDGELIKKDYRDSYELFKVSSEYFNKNLDDNQRQMGSVYFVKCKDTSTNREYFIWVDILSVYQTNFDTKSIWRMTTEQVENKINALMAIAWTIQTNIAKGKISKIIRQGDCVLIKPKSDFLPLDNPRHLTEKEYLKLLVAES
jgi:hypothetical protein